MKDSRKKFVIIIMIILANGFLIYWGMKKTCHPFWSCKIVDILTLDVSILVSFWLVENLTFKRRGNDYLAEQLDIIACDISKDKVIDHSNDKEAVLLQVYIANRLMYLKQACPSVAQKDMNYINDKFNEIRMYYEEHPESKTDDPTYKRLRSNLLIKVSKVKLGLYGFELKNDEEQPIT